MTAKRIRTKEVLVYLGAHDQAQFIVGLRQEGLFENDELEPAEADELRLAHVLMEELGVNAAGVDVALHLRRRLFALEERVRELATELEAGRIERDS